MMIFLSVEGTLEWLLIWSRSCPTVNKKCRTSWPTSVWAAEEAAAPDSVGKMCAVAKTPKKIGVKA